MTSRMRPRHRAPAFYGESADSEEDSRPMRTRERPNYVVDISSDDENQDSEGFDVEITVPLPRQPPPRRTPARPLKHKIQPSKKSPYTSYKRRKVLGALLKQNFSLGCEEQGILPGGRIPPWQTLEHDILTDILKKAAYPLYQGYLRPNASIKWLVGLSYLSESFHASAMAALLSSPPLTNPNGLIGLLRLDQNTLSTNYRMKPRKLVVEARHSLVQKSTKISLPELVSLTPLLESLRIVSNYDEIQAIWTQPSVAKKTYIYESSLFQALETCSRLREFEWNGRFGPGLPELIDTIMSTHTRLNGLSSITLMNLNVAEKLSIEGQESLQQRLLAAMNNLPELKNLKITNCNVFGNFMTLASLQTSQLKSLTITACPSLTSSGLEIFLNAKGATLEHLRLIGCQTCDGAFLSRLDQLCGSLHTLQIDLSFSDVSSWNDTDAHFEDYLPEGPISTFPSTLVNLELNNLRRIDSTQLEASLTSLVESSLPLLRKLSIKAILTSDYRQRARIRREWGQKLQYVFLRQSTPPVPYSNTQNKLPVSSVETVREASANSTSDNSKKRQSSRVSKSSCSAGQTITSKVFKTNGTSVQRQGLCELVELRVDHQRPAEYQYLEKDFVDDEPSGDEMYHD